MLDSASLQALQAVKLKYLALLGPELRGKQVTTAAGLAHEDSRIEISGPAGLDLGGELPESIAISMLAECHDKLRGSSAKSLSNYLKYQLWHGSFSRVELD